MWPFTSKFRRSGFRRPGFRPRLEAFEDRALPSTLTVTNPLDDGSVGSLRYEMGIAQSGDKIVFADSMAGQTITLNPAYGPLQGSIALTIQGPGGADQVTIDGAGQTQIFHFYPGPSGFIDNVTLSNLTLINGNANNSPGGGNSAGGGAVYEGNGNLTLSNCVFSQNSADGAGGGAINFGSVNPLGALPLLTCNNCIFSSNHADVGLGGAIGLFRGVESIDHCTFVDNHADQSQGGAIFLIGGGVIDHSTFSGNHADVGGFGGAIATVTSLTLEHDMFSGNHAYGVSGYGGAGGAVFLKGGQDTIAYCVFSGNQADDGGAIYNAGGIFVTIDHSSLSDNQAYAGGAIFNADFVNTTPLTINASDVFDNVAVQGGGIYNDDGCQLTITNSADCGNDAIVGDDVFNLGHLTIVRSDVCDIVN
jgi:predicted outer membrane repeat protein